MNTEKPLRILILDDEVNSSKMVATLISKHFPDLIISGIVQTVKEALSHIESNEVDIVTLDIELRKESGFDLLDKTKERKFEFICLSASKEYAFQAFEYGASGYLLKPINEHELTFALSKFIKPKPLVQLSSPFMDEE